MTASKCIKIEDFMDLLKDIAQAVEIDQLGDRETRVNVWKIADETVDTMIDTLEVPNQVFDASGHTSRKLANDLNIPANHKEKIAQLVTRMKENSLLGDSDAKAMRSQMVALKEVMAAVKGEVDKANNMNVELDVISPDGVPNVPMSRVAAMIGRKVLYQNGYRATSLGDDGKAAQSEHLYYLVGEKILESLEAGGFVKINEANSGQSTLVDYIQGDKAKVDRSKPTSDKVKSITFLPKSLGVSKDKDSNDMDALLGRSSEGSDSVFGSYQKIIDAVHRVTVPEKITFPTIGSENRDNKVRHQRNSYEASKELKKAVKEVEDKPLYLNSDIHSLLGNIAKEIEGSGMSASSWIRRNKNVNDSAILASLFNVEKSNDIVSDNASHVGRNISKTTPIDDIVEHFGKFKDNPALFFSMFLGRNARAYVEASVMNPQTSKAVRYGLEVDPYKMKVGSDDYKFYVDKVARVIFPKRKDGSVPAETLLAENMANKEMGNETLAALKAYDQYLSAKDANSQLKALAKMQSSGLKMENFSELLSTVKAVKGIRDSLGSDTLESNYMVSSDATGSGGLLTLLQALGSTQSDNISDVLKSLGVFKSDGSQNIEEVKDIYGILTRSLIPFLEGETDTNTAHDLSIGSEYDIDSVKRILGSVKDNLFDGNFRNLSKSPTMTFIYDQSETGAIESMSETFADKLIEKLRKKGPVTNEIQNLIYNLLPVDRKQVSINDLKSSPDLKSALRKGFEDSGVPGFLYDALSVTITEEYLKNHKILASRVFEIAEKYVGDPNFKVLPAAYVTEKMKGLKKGESWEPTVEEVKKYGIPMTKLYDVAREQDNGDVVLTREERFAKTVMNTSFIHSADTASLFGAIAGLPTKHGTGAVLVHDDIRSNPMLVRDNDQRYVEATRDVAYHYDIQEQVLLAANAYAGASLNGKSEYTKVLEQIRERKAAKQKLIEDNFDEKSNSIIGDGAGYRSLEISGEKTTAKESGGKSPVQSTATRAGRKPVADVNKEDLATRTVLEKLSGKSPIIAGFLQSRNKAAIARGEKDSFDPSTDTVTVSGSARQKDIEHEIVHSYTTGILQKVQNAEKQSDFIKEFDLVNGKGQFNQTVRDVRYVQKAMNKVDLSKLSDSSRDRMQYALNQPDSQAAMGEFLSIMSTEPGVASDVYKQFGTGSTLKQLIDRVVKRIQEIIKSPSANDLAGDTVDSELLYSSVNNIVNNGKSFRDLNAEENTKLQKQFGQELFARSKAGEYVEKSRDYFELLNSSVARTINDPAVRKAWQLGSSLDYTLSQMFPAYVKATNYMKGVYDDSEALQSLVHKITNDNVNNETKNEVLSTFSKLRAERNDLTSRELQKFKRITSKMSDNDMKIYRDFTQKMALQDYFQHAEGVVDIDARVAELKTTLGARTKKLDTIVDMNIHETVTSNTFYNVGQIFGSRGEMQNQAKAYVALRSIQEMGIDRFNKFLENKDLVTLVKDTVLANESLMFDGGIDTAQVRDNKLAENYETPVMMKAVKPEDMKFMPQWKKDGWKRVKSGEKPGGLVVLYKSEIDQTFQEGVFTDIRTQSADIPVSEGHKGFENVVKTGDGKYSLVLTQAQRDEMGASNDPTQSLVRTMAHNMTMKESSIIRDKLLEKETYWNLTDKNTDDLVKVIKDKSRDNPWFLGASDNFDLDKNPDLMKHYTPVTKKLSDHNNFDEKIQYVRKDIGYWLVGASERSVARDPKVQWAIRITKNLVSGMKIGLIALNPVKIMNDNLSNLTYLGVRGVDPVFMQKQYREISFEFNQYHKLRNKVIGLKVKSYAEPKKYKSQIEKLEKELKNHPANGLIERGFLNSLGSELIMNTDDPSSGFKSDIDTVLKKVLQDNEGKNNSVGRLLMKAANWNVGLEDLLETWSPVFGSLNSTKEVESSINDIAERWKNIKTKEDAVAYIHQYMNSPDSEFVKLGTHMTDLSDVMAKETLYRHLVSNGMSPKKAELEVIDSFPDYKEAMPLRVRQLSDVGILMFPSYWLRIQKAIYRMIKDRPVSFGAETIAQEMMGLDGPTILDSNILSKWNSHLGIFHNPWDNVGAGNIVPTHVI